MSTSVRTGAEQRLRDLAITLPAPPTPFGAYAEAVETGNLLFLSGMLPTDGRAAAFIGRVGAELDVAAAAQAADVFGEVRNPCRLVYGVASLPLGTPVELEIIFEVAG